MRSGAPSGRAWFRTSDLSRVKHSTYRRIFYAYAGNSCAY